MFLPFSLAGGGHIGAELLLLLLLPFGLLALHPGGPAVAPPGPAGDPPRARDPRAAVAGHRRRGRPLHPGVGFVAAATWCVARAMDPDAPVSRVAFAAVLSWIAGFAAVPVPAGAGVREAVFIAASGLDSGLGATVAVATRVLFILADGGAAVAAAPAPPPSSRRAAAPI